VEANLSRHEGEMLLNGAYLVAAAKVERLRELVQQLAERHQELDVRIELTGPWPRTTSSPDARPPSPRPHEQGPGPRDRTGRPRRPAARRGVVIAGDITLSVADVDLVYVSLRALITSVATAEEKRLLPQMGSAL
jgi:hypothetical protein